MESCQRKARPSRKGRKQKECRGARTFLLSSGFQAGPG